MLIFFHFRGRRNKSLRLISTNATTTACIQHKCDTLFCVRFTFRLQVNEMAETRSLSVHSDSHNLTPHFCICSTHRKCFSLLLILFITSPLSLFLLWCYFLPYPSLCCLFLGLKKIKKLDYLTVYRIHTYVFECGPPPFYSSFSPSILLSIPNPCWWRIYMCDGYLSRHFYFLKIYEILFVFTFLLGTAGFREWFGVNVKQEGACVSAWIWFESSVNLL